MKNSRVYFVNAPIDALCVGGASLLLFVLYRWRPDIAGASQLVTTGVLLAAFNWPHFSATAFRLYGSRATLRQYPATAMGAPLICAAAVVGSFASPLLIAPIFLKVFLLWSPFHYSGQTIGVTMVYARRSGIQLGKLARLSLSAFVYLSFLAPSATAEPFPVGRFYYGVSIPNFGMAMWIPPVLRASLLATGALALLFLAGECVRARRFPSALLLLPAISQYVWFEPGAGVRGFQELVPLFHSVQYLLIAWSMDLHEHAAHDSTAIGRSYVVGRSLRWAAFNFAGGLLLFWLLPRAIGGAGLTAVAAAGIVGAGVQMHHFFVDGVIWKLKSAAVSSPLMATLEDLLPARDSTQLPDPEPAA